MLQAGIGLGKAGEDLSLCLEAFDDRKAAEQVFEHGHIALILLTDLLFPGGQPSTGGQGGGDGDQAEQDGGQGQLPAVPQHHGQSADEHERLREEKEKLVEVIFFDGVGVVGEGGEVPPGVFLGEGPDALLGQLSKGQVLVLGQGAVDKSSLKAIHDEFADQNHGGQAQTEPEGIEKLLQISGGHNIQDVAQEIGDNQIPKRAQADERCGDDKAKPITPEHGTGVEGAVKLLFHDWFSFFSGGGARMGRLRMSQANTWASSGCVSHRAKNRKGTKA